MRKAFIIFILLFPNLLNGQDSSFQDLLKKYNGNRNEIDSIYVKRYFGITFDENFNKAFTDKIIIQKPYFIGITCLLTCGAGGTCESKILRTFDYSGKVIDEIDYESDYADCEFNDNRSCILTSDTLLVITNQKTTSDCEKDSMLTNKVSVEFIHLSNSGKFIKEKETIVDTRRKYYFTSSSKLTATSLKDVKKEDLAEMRNEIFAAHGYIFKTEKWSQFFTKKIWYKPLSEDVDNDLTIIEKGNIELILQYENI
jgi:hypothetical protein